jgi:polyhydroxybutyrate depolymerase
MLQRARNHHSCRERDDASTIHVHAGVSENGGVITARTMAMALQRNAWVGLLALIGAILPAHARDGCGGDAGTCTIAEGSYEIALPDAPLAEGETRPAVLFFHGAGGTGASVLDKRFWTQPFVEAGYAVIGVNGLMRPGNAFGTGWSFRPEGPQQRDELAFARAVLSDAGKRFRIDRRRVLMTGFSIGGAMVWYLACKEPGLAAAYAPVAGGFWRPHPTRCAGPVDLLHTHGWRDRTVPLEGRPLRGGELMQGDILEGLQLWRQVNGCKGLRPDAFFTDTQFWRRDWTTCESGRMLSLVLHPSDHDDVPMAWAGVARAWFEERVQRAIK